MPSAPSLHAPHIWKDKRIGLFGGTFNPPHEGHLHIANTALNLLKLDYIWWLISPQNPLKTTAAPDDVQRMQQCHDLIGGAPKHIVSNIEKDLHIKTSFQSIRALKHHFPQTHFVWVMGMDNANSFHRWHNWDNILNELPILSIARPPMQTSIQNTPLKMKRTQKHVFLDRPHACELTPNTCFWHQNGRLINQSSTQIRTRQK